MWCDSSFPTCKDAWNIKAWGGMYVPIQLLLDICLRENTQHSLHLISLQLRKKESHSLN